MFVVKRDGRIKEFSFDRIESAIRSAYLRIYSVEDLLRGVGFNRILNEFDSVLEELTSMFDKINNSGMEKINIEFIQEKIIDVLEKKNKLVASCYVDYRDRRTAIRDANNELIRGIEGLLNNTNLEVAKENSNKKAMLSSTQRDLIAGEVSKFIARKNIPKHIMDAHDKGMIKVHDLDYFMQGIHNCELVNLEDMLQNGTVINGKMIEKPKSLRTAMTIATQIAAQVASSTYGGQTITLSHLAPFVRISEEKIRKKYESRNVDAYLIEKWVSRDLIEEIRDAVQTFNYQVSTIMTTNGQAPFISVAMYISENPEYEKETVMLIEEFLNQRIKGMRNEFGVISTQTFPKLLYFTDENNINPDSEYYWLTELAVKSTSIRMNPDYVSAKQMEATIGHVFPPMGCRAFLSPFQDKSGNFIFYGRGNLGVQTINLPYIALSSGGDIDKFWIKLNEALHIVRDMCELRYDKLRGVTADSAPILWQHGAISRLDADDSILKAIDERGFTVSIGYAGIYETVKALTGLSHTTSEGFKLAEEIMKHLNMACARFKEETPHLRFALYGTPQESTTGWFSDKLRKRFGIIDDITDKGWITNSYHVDVREDIDAFAKLKLEGALQKYSTGGAVSYVETYNLSNNIPAVLKLIQVMYDEIMYAEINFEYDICGECKYEGVMDNDHDTLKWVCPQCGNNDQKTLSVVRRTCGYLGENEWTEARLRDILNRVKHI